MRGACGGASALRCAAAAFAARFFCALRFAALLSVGRGAATAAEGAAVVTVPSAVVAAPGSSTPRLRFSARLALRFDRLDMKSCEVARRAGAAARRAPGGRAPPITCKCAEPVGTDVRGLLLSQSPISMLLLCSVTAAGLAARPALRPAAGTRLASPIALAEPDVSKSKLDLPEPEPELPTPTEEGGPLATLLPLSLLIESQKADRSKDLGFEDAGAFAWKNEQWGDVAVLPGSITGATTAGGRDTGRGWLQFCAAVSLRLRVRARAKVRARARARVRVRARARVRARVRVRARARVRVRVRVRARARARARLGFLILSLSLTLTRWARS